MELEVLISALKKDPVELIKQMRIETPAVLVNQCDRTGSEVFEYAQNRIKVLSDDGRGVGRSRNLCLENADTYNVKDEIRADIFAAGDHVDVTAVSKGHGFQGAIKRCGNHRGPMKHGSKYHRHAGSNGSSSDPSRVYPGKGMPGRMGGEQVTVQNLTVVRVDAENNLILVKGAVPGPKKSLVSLKETTRTDLR